MEQQRKAEWDELHFGDSNPYDELPELKIYTYDLGKILTDKSYVELEDKRSISGSFSVSGLGTLSTTTRPCLLLHRWAILSTKAMFGAF